MRFYKRMLLRVGKTKSSLQSTGKVSRNPFWTIVDRRIPPSVSSQNRQWRLKKRPQLHISRAQDWACKRDDGPKGKRIALSKSNSIKWHLQRWAWRLRLITLSRLGKVRQSRSSRTRQEFQWFHNLSLTRLKSFKANATNSSCWLSSRKRIVIHFSTLITSFKRPTPWTQTLYSRLKTMRWAASLQPTLRIASWESWGREWIARRSSRKRSCIRGSQRKRMANLSRRCTAWRALRTWGTSRSWSRCREMPTMEQLRPGSAEPIKLTGRSNSFMLSRLRLAFRRRWANKMARLSISCTTRWEGTQSRKSDKYSALSMKKLRFKSSEQHS